MTAEIISVGTELLMGQITNTDAQYVAKGLRDLGFDHFHQSVVGDNFERLLQNLQTAYNRADIIITTGGLGPTQDDMTKETVCSFCGKEPVFNEKVYDKIQSYFKAKGHGITSNNKKQACFPKDAIILENTVGTAPGCILEKGGKYFIVLPGPPRELQPMFEKSVIPFLQSKSSDVLYSENIQVFGVGESKVESQITELINTAKNYTIATYCHPGYVTIRVTAKSDDINTCKAIVSPVSKDIAKMFGDAVFEIGDREINQVVGDYLMDKGITVSVSESCSGGLVSDALVKISGISAVYKLGVTSYSNEAKMNVLGVKKYTLDSVGAVSKETAIEMAIGVRRLGNSDIGISTTGIAGPKSDNTSKPVGLVYIALATEDEVICNELHLSGNRQDIRIMTVLNVFNMIRKYYMDKGEI